MQSVVFINAFGQEKGLWHALTGGELKEQFFEGARMT